jgi:hypothetical protein
VNSPSIDWGHLCFQAVPHRSDVPTRLDDSLRNAQLWGDLQCGVWEADYAIDPALNSSETLWLCALKNPWPDRTLKSLRVESRNADPLVICGLTLFQGRENPLRHELSLYRITLPESSVADAGRWKVSVDFGVAARTLPAALRSRSVASPSRESDWAMTPTRATRRQIYTEVAQA